MSGDPDLLAYLGKLRANCEAVLGSDAASEDARAPARDWRLLLDLAIELVEECPSCDGELLLPHWHRLTTRITDELRAGLHLGAADVAADLGVAP